MTRYRVGDIMWYIIMHLIHIVRHLIWYIMKHVIKFIIHDLIGYIIKH